MDSLRVARVDHVKLDIYSSHPRHRQTGTVHLTPHHLFFSPDTDTAPNSPTELWIPYPTITLLNRLPQTIAGLYPVQIRTKIYQSCILLFGRDREAEDVWQSIRDSAVITSVEQLYAFFYTLPSASASISGWDTFNPRSEFARQGVGSRSRAWRFTDINKDYSLCPTYPAKLVVPTRISDSVLTYAGKYRSKGRIPALTYLHWANQASMTRSSQPMVGLKQARSSQDEHLVDCIFSSHVDTVDVYGSTTTNLIVDARPTTNAMANVAMGAGTENMEHYRAAKKAYLGIDNIHVMRNSLKIITDAIGDAEVAGVLDRAQLRRSNWLRHISSLLEGTLLIVRNIHLNASHVLVHCSDGWDRTSQLCATAQVCLDPYYRTFQGFKVLIEKDWLAFGHKFLDRSGHLSSSKHFTVADVNAGEDESDEEVNGAQKAAQAFFASVQKQFSSNSHQKEVSPVFHQFLDTVRQIQRQYPSRFEFSEHWLIDLYSHLYACQFGTFVFNSERERKTTPTTGGQPYVDRTVSAWDSVSRSDYLNSDYDPALDDREARGASADQGVLFPDSKNVRFWHGLFHRGDEEMNGSLRVEVETAQLVGPIQAGQVDPVSAEGVVDTLTGNLAPTDSFRPFKSDSSAYTMRAQPIASSSRPSTPRDVLASSSSKGGWGWSQLGSGALSALQGAAKEMKSFGQDALGQIKAEAGELDREMWRGDRVPTSNGIRGEGRALGDLPAGPRPPSEINPWGTNPGAGVAEQSSMLPGPTPRPTLATQKTSWGREPWGDKLGGSLGDLRLDHKAMASTTPQPASTPAGKEVDDALGGDRKAWDPLGAL